VSRKISQSRRASIVDPTGVLSISQSSTAGKISANLVIGNNVGISSLNGSIALSSTGQLTFGSSTSTGSITGGKTVSLTGLGVTIADGSTITSGGALTVSNTGASAALGIGNNVSLTAGSFKTGVPSYPTVIPSIDVNVPGNITLQSSGSGGLSLGTIQSLLKQAMC